MRRTALPGEVTMPGGATAGRTTSAAISSSGSGDATVVEFLLPLVHVLVLLSILRFMLGSIWPERGSVLGEVFAPLMGVMKFALKLCRLAVHGACRQMHALWRSSVRQRGLAMTALLTLIVMAATTTLLGLLTVSLPLLLLAIPLWLAVWPLWQFTNWLAQRRFRPRPMPARRRR